MMDARPHKKVLMDITLKITLKMVTDDTGVVVSL